jgi:predicted ester cyclase
MLALWNGEDVDARSIYAYGCVENGGEEVFDPEAIPPIVDALRSAAPDLRFELLDWFAEGSRYVLRLRAAGTHHGALATPIGIAQPTGRDFSMHGIEVFEVHDDLITAVWIGWNYGELYAALGARF